MVVQTRASRASKAAKTTSTKNSTKNTSKTIRKSKKIRPFIPVKANVPKPREDSKYGMSDSERSSPGIDWFFDGPDDEPVYDHLGYEISYDKCLEMEARANAPRDTIEEIEAYTKMIMDEGKQEKRKRELLGLPPDCKPGESEMDYKLSKILDKPYHKINMADYEDFYNKGFALEPEDMIISKENGESRDFGDVEWGSIFRI